MAVYFRVGFLGRYLSSDKRATSTLSLCLLVASRELGAGKENFEMKNWLFLAMFVALGFVACDDDDERVDPYAAYHGFHVKDTVGLKVGWRLWGAYGNSYFGPSLDTSWVSECVPTHLFQNTLEEIGKVYMVGLRNGKLWLGKFDLGTREQLHEWMSKENFPLHRRVDHGYGEIEEFDVELYGISSITRQDDENVAFVVCTRTFDGEFRYSYDLCFAHGTDITMYMDKGEDLYDSNPVREWSDGYLYYGGFTNREVNVSCYSREGKFLFDGEYDVGVSTKNVIYPLSMEEAIVVACYNYFYFRGFHFRRENLKTGTVVWESRIVPELKEEDARMEGDFSSLDLWVYTVEVTYRSGEKEKHEFRLNVETGAWTEL